MALHIDVKYLNLISSKLEFFKRKNDSLWNFRCPMCGDSQRKKTKARGYVYRKNNDLFYRCHNCNHGTTFSKFLLSMDETLYKEYVRERYLEGDTGHHNYQKPILFKAPVFKEKININLESIESLPNKHWVKQYVINRVIPVHHHKNLYFAPDFKEFVKGTGSDKYKELKENDARLVIPFFDELNNLFAYQGRALLDNSIRYVSIRLDSTQPYIFGMDRANRDSLIYVVEGPIDSLFLPNAIAAASSDLLKVKEKYKNCVFIFDNEPKNKDLCKLIFKAISQDEKVVIWPSELQYKDINDMVLHNLNVESIIKSNTFSGLEAKAKFTFWKKC